MANVKDLQKKIEFTTDDPFTGSPTYTEIPAVRLDGESDRPADEVEDAELLDGRIGEGGHMLDFQYVVRKDTEDPDGVIDALEEAAGDTPIWFRETDLQSGATAQVLGGKNGAIIQVGESDQGFGGHRVHTVRVTATAAEPGQLIQDDPNGGT
jgi:hypothetical protein